MNERTTILESQPGTSRSPNQDGGVDRGRGVVELVLEAVIPSDALAVLALEVAPAVAALLPPVTQPKYLTVAEAAVFLRCDRQRIYDLQSSGRLSRFKDGGRTLVALSELESLVTCASTQRERPRLVARMLPTTREAA